MRLLQNPWIPLLVQLPQARTRGQLRFWHLLCPWWGPYKSHRSGMCLALRVAGESNTFGWAPCTEGGGCPHWGSNAALFPLPVLYGAGSPSRFGCSTWQPEVAGILFPKKTEFPPMPPTAHQKEHNTRGRGQWKNWCIWESDNTGLRMDCTLFWVGRKFMIF